MRRFLTLLVVAMGLLATAHAQNTPWPGQCPAGTPSGALGCFPQAVAPLGTDLVYGWESGQSPKTRAFQVQQLFSAGYPTTVSTLTVTGATSLNGGTNTGGWTGSYQNTGQIIIKNNDATTPWSLSNSSGLVILNTMTGNYSGAVSFNRISATYSGHGSSTGGIGTNALSIAIGPGTTYDGTELFALGVGFVEPLGDPTGTASDYGAGSFGVTVNDTTMTGGALGARLYAINATTNVGTSGRVRIAHAVHVEQGITTGGQVAYRDAFSALATGQAPATIDDAAYIVTCSGTTTSQCYNYLMLLEQRPAEGILRQPLTTTSSLIGYDVTTPCVGAVCPMTMAHGIYLPNVSFSLDYMVFKNWFVHSDGHEGVGQILISEQTPSPPITSTQIVVSAVNTGNTASNTHCYTGTGAAGCWELLIGNTPITAWIPYYTVDPPGYVILKGATPTVGIGQLGLGTTTVAPGTTTCPVGPISGQTVIGCLVVSVGSVLRNMPFF